MSKELVVHKSLREQVAEILGKEIAAGHFSGGTLPTVRVLAQRFEVSTLTIGGALENLEARGLIERVHGKGVFVRDRRGRSRKLGARTLRFGIGCYSAPSELRHDNYYGEVWSGLLDAAQGGPHLTLMPWKEGAEFETASRAHAETPLDGLVLLGLTDRSAATRLHRLGVPLVLADHHFEDAPFDCVTLDSHAGSVRAVRHLAGLGHREIGILTSTAPEKNPERLAGFHDGLNELGLRASLQWAGYSAWAGGEALGKRLLAERHRPTALYAWNGAQAAGLETALRAGGVHVPQDVSLVACGSPTFLNMHPGMTTVVADGVELGRRALALLHARIDEPDAPVAIERIPMNLEVRRSTAPPPKMPPLERGKS